MSKVVTLQLTELEYKELLLCCMLGDLVKDSVEEKSEAEMASQIQLHQKINKADYEADIKGMGYEDGFYFFDKDIEDKMLDIYEEFKEYITSGEEDEEMEAIRRQLEELEKTERKQNKKP